MKIGIFTAVCERDFHWFPQFIKQAELLRYPVAWFADKLSPESLETLRNHPMTHFVHENKTEQFSERSKEFAFKGLKGMDWAIQMDVDESWETDAKELIEKSLRENPDGFIAKCPMVTVHKKGSNLFQRMDPYFTAGTESNRARIYNLKYEWHWIDPITCGAQCFVNNQIATVETFDCPVTSVHWGYATYDSCQEHKEKWEDIWKKTWGKKPYSTYEMLTDRKHNIPTVPLADKYYKHL